MAKTRFRCEECGRFARWAYDDGSIGWRRSLGTCCADPERVPFWDDGLRAEITPRDAFLLSR